MSPLQKITEECDAIISLSEKAIPYEEKPGSRCPECNLETHGYRHWNGCTLDEKHFIYEKHAANNAAKLASALRICAEASQAAAIMFDKLLSDLAIKEKEPGILLQENPFEEAIQKAAEVLGEGT